MSPEIYGTIVARIAKGDTCTMCGKCPLPDKFFTVAAMMKRGGETLNMTMPELWERSERAAHVCREGGACVPRRSGF